MRRRGFDSCPIAAAHLPWRSLPPDPWSSQGIARWTSTVMDVYQRGIFADREGG